MKFKVNPFLKDTFFIFITQSIILITVVLIYRLIAKNFGSEGVGEYSLIKRVISFSQSILFLGLGVGLPRYIAISQSKEQKIDYARTGGLLVTIITIGFLIFVNVFKNYFAGLFFGSSMYANFISSLSFLLTGVVLSTLLCSYFQGMLQFKAFNFLQLATLSLIPLGVLLFFKNITVSELISLIGIFTILVVLFFSLFFAKDIFIKTGRKLSKMSLKRLLHFSLPRLPGDFLLSGLFFLSVIFVAHLGSIKSSGYLSVSQTLIQGIGGAMLSLELILLPKVSNLIANGREKEIGKKLNFLIGAVIQCSFFLCFQMIFFSDAIIKYWLGDAFLEAAPVMHITLISITFYIFYVSMRSILDASKVKPINTINLFISLCVFLTVSGFLSLVIKIFTPVISLSIAFTSGLLCLGSLTYVSIRKIYPRAINKDFNYLVVALVLNILFIAAAVIIKPFIIRNLYYLIFYGFIMAAVYLWLLWLLKIDWIREMPKRLFC